MGIIQATYTVRDSWKKRKKQPSTQSGGRLEPHTREITSAPIFGISRDLPFCNTPSKLARQWVPNSSYNRLCK